jgi:molybdate transport system substrate-binding protein
VDNHGRGCGQRGCFGFDDSSQCCGHKVTIIFKSGVDVTAALRAGDQADLAMSTDVALDELAKEGKIATGSRVDFARPRVGLAVRQGAPKPDISTVDGVRKTLLAAKSIGYSKGPSGIHLEGVMKRLGIFDQVKAKLSQPALGVRVGTMVARGDVEIGVQQVNELLPIPGIDFVGPLPNEMQPALVYSLAVPTTAKDRTAAAALMKYLTSEAALPVFKKLGLDPS